MGFKYANVNEHRHIKQDVTMISNLPLRNK